MELILILFALYVTLGLTYALFQIKSALRFGQICPDELMKDDPSSFTELEMLGINFNFLTSFVFFAYNVLKWPGLLAQFGFEELIEDGEDGRSWAAQSDLKR
jgi:hypothetical protein